MRKKIIFIDIKAMRENYDAFTVMENMSTNE
jgi:hypothetical protein